MPRAKLSEIIGNFRVEDFTRFFRLKTQAHGNFRPSEEKLANYNDTDFSGIVKIGQIEFSDIEKLIVVVAKVAKSLSERSGKKAQYEKAKKILKDLQIFTAGIFIFYDDSGNFRFSLIYPESIGVRRQWSSFRRFTYFVSREFTNKTFLQRIGDGDFSTLARIKDAFSVEKVTKEFYESIANWYFWAVEHCQFPKDAEVEENGRNISVIRLITRIIFIWFMRERGLVPKGLFEEKNIVSILKNISADNSTYYMGILQNLFFATLSTKKEERQFGSEVRGYKGHNPDFGNQYVFRYQELFKNPDDIKKYFEGIPFLNGGLFECLDDKRNGIIIDGFSRTKKNQPTVPNFLFFSQEKKVDLNKAYGTQNKKYHVHGLLDILSSFNFTIDENSPDDSDIALDPELLGRVFENLLASFNPETSTTARKATGSYYTPREIVDYMVAESLKAYFKTHLTEIENLDEKLEKFFFTGSEENPFNQKESKKLVELIESVKIVDPAVGSGAFPMGALNKLVFILNKVDPGNELWKQAQLNAADAILDPNIKIKIKKDIEEYFKSKKPDYWRKLYLIQRCIYGVDIQQIAVEITKLRFFISLLVDEDKDDIQPLPNLDFKIMQGNSLLEEYEGIKLFDEKLLTDNTFDKQKQIVLIKEKQSVLQREYLKLHASGQLTSIKQAQLNVELKKLDKQLNILNKPDRKFGEMDGLFDAQNEAKQKREALKRLHKEFFETSEKKEKDKLREQIEKMEWNLIEATLKEQKKEAELKKLEKFKKSKSKPFFLWQLNFAEVFEKGGFDIVIANPPYLKERDNKNIFEPVNNSSFGKRYHQGKMDFWYYFLHKAIDIVKNDGVISYITSRYWLNSSGAKKLIQRVAVELSFVNFIDIGKLKVFDAAAGQHMVATYKKTKTINNFIYKKLENDISDINKNTNTQNVIIKKLLNKNIYSNNEIILDNSYQNLSHTVPLGKVVDICQGIVQNPDKVSKKFSIKYKLIQGAGVFVLDEKEYKNLQPLTDEEKYFIRNFYDEKDIGKYLFIKKKKYLLYLTKSNCPEIFKYPRLREHLNKYKKIMQERRETKKGTILWFQLHWPREEKYFEKEKIVIPSMFSESNATLINEPAYFGLSTNLIITSDQNYHLKYLLSIINSKFALDWFYKNGKKRGAGVDIGVGKLRLFPIAIANKDGQKPFIETVDKILAITKSGDYSENLEKQAKVKEYEKQIDQIVYELYNLTPEEKKIVENY